MALYRKSDTMKLTRAMVDAGAVVAGSADLAEAVWVAMWRARSGSGGPVERDRVDEIAAAELEVLGGASVASVRKRYGLSGSTVQRLMRLARGER